MTYRNNETDYQSHSSSGSYSKGGFAPTVGEVYRATVQSINPFGATVLLHFEDPSAPEITGLVHISQIADHRIEAVSDELHVGQEVEVMVIKPDDRGRLRLSIKAVPKGSMPKTGQTYAGRVVKIESYGAFVNLPEFHRDGLVHITELSNERVGDIYSFIRVDEPVKVKVLGIETDYNTGRVKIKLSLKQADR